MIQLIRGVTVRQPERAAANHVRSNTMTRFLKFSTALVVAAVFGLTTSSAQAFWGRRQVVTTGYPVVAAAPVVTAMPVVAASPVVTGYAPVTSYYAPVRTSYSLPSVPAVSPVVESRTVVTSNYAPAVAPVTSYYGPTTTY